jgi:hypothetical protein
MTFTIDVITSRRVVAAHLTTPLVVEITEVSGEAFFDCSITHKLARMLCNDGYNRKDVLHKFVRVFDTMKELRDDHLRTQAGRVKGRTANKTVTAKTLEVAGDAFTINVPASETVPARSVRVLLGMPKDPLMIGFDASVLEWLAAIVAADRECGVAKVGIYGDNDIQAIVKAETAGLKQVSVCSNGEYVRARRKGVDNKIENAYFKINVDNKSETIDEAMRFTQGGKRCRPSSESVHAHVSSDSQSA